ncbi:hypothetical protein MHYP_G00260190 [Metynnis hypsauchen]
MSDRCLDLSFQRNILSLGLIQYSGSLYHCQHSTVLLPKWPHPDASFTALNIIVCYACELGAVLEFMHRNVIRTARKPIREHYVIRTVPGPPKMAPVKRHANEAHFKLQAISYAAVNGNRAAARQFSVNESMVWKWRKQENELRQKTNIEKKQRKT